MNREKQILFFLATEKGYYVLKQLINNKKNKYIGIVVSFHEIGMQKDYYDDLNELCLALNIPFFEWKNAKNFLKELIDDYDITSCVAISWRYIIPLSINQYLEDDLIIFHDSLLPKYRGFAPLVTAMINEEEQVGVSVLYASEMVDCGDIITQKSINLRKESRIQEVIDEISIVYAELANQLIEDLVMNNIKSIPQNEKEATYSIWRDEDDYWIDWSLSAEKIKRFVNALGYPYKGAKTVIEGDLLRIIDCSVVNDICFAIRTPGKIWLLKDNKPVIICGTGLLCIDKALDENGSVYVFRKLRSRVGKRII